MINDYLSNPRNEAAFLEACTRRIIPIDQSLSDSAARIRNRYQVLGAIALAENTKGPITLRDAVGLSEGDNPWGNQHAFLQTAIGRFRAFQQLLDEGQVELCLDADESGSNLHDVAARLSLAALGLGSGLPRTARVPDSLRLSVLNAIEDQERAATPDEGAEFLRVINLPEWWGKREWTDSERKERRSAAAMRMRALKQLLTEGAVGLGLVRSQWDTGFDVVVRVNPCTAAKSDAGSDQALPPGPARD